MATKSPKTIAKAITELTLKELQGIGRMYVCGVAADASSAINEGARLLAIARMDNDKRGDGFRYLMGIPRGMTLTPHLREVFSQSWIDDSISKSAW